MAGWLGNAWTSLKNGAASAWNNFWSGDNGQYGSSYPKVAPGPQWTNRDKGADAQYQFPVPDGGVMPGYGSNSPRKLESTQVPFEEATYNIPFSRTAPMATGIYSAPSVAHAQQGGAELPTSAQYASQIPQAPAYTYQPLPYAEFGGLDNYAVSQNQRYEQAMRSGDQDMINRLQADAQANGYQLTDPFAPYGGRAAYVASQQQRFVQAVQSGDQALAQRLIQDSVSNNYQLPQVAQAQPQAVPAMAPTTAPAPAYAPSPVAPAPVVPQTPTTAPTAPTQAPPPPTDAQQGQVVQQTGSVPTPDTTQGSGMNNTMGQPPQQMPVPDYRPTTPDAFNDQIKDPTKPIATADQLQQTVNGYMSEIDQIRAGAGNDAVVQNMIASALSNMLAKIDEVEKSTVGSMRDQMGNINQDPAMVAALGLLRQEMDRYNKDLVEEMGSRGILQSSVYLNARNDIEKNGMTQQQQLIASRLSQLQEQLNQALMSFSQQKLGAQQQFSTMGVEAKNQALNRQAQADQWAVGAKADLTNIVQGQKNYDQTALATWEQNKNQAGAQRISAAQNQSQLDWGQTMDANKFNTDLWNIQDQSKRGWSTLNEQMRSNKVGEAQNQAQLDEQIRMNNVGIEQWNRQFGLDTRKVDLQAQAQQQQAADAEASRALQARGIALDEQRLGLERQKMLADSGTLSNLLGDMSDLVFKVTNGSLNPVTAEQIIRQSGYPEAYQGYLLSALDSVRQRKAIMAPTAGGNSGYGLPYTFKLPGR